MENPYRPTPKFAQRLAAWALPKRGLRSTLRDAWPTYVRLGPAIAGIPAYLFVRQIVIHGWRDWQLAAAISIVWFVIAVPIAFTMSRPFQDWRNARIQRRAAEWERSVK